MHVKVLEGEKERKREWVSKEEKRERVRVYQQFVNIFGSIEFQ